MLPILQVGIFFHQPLGWEAPLMWSCSLRTLLLLTLPDPATLDFVLAVLGLFLCMLRLVLSPTPTDKLASTPSPSPLASFSEGFYLAVANLGMM
jgi:hypothetical protein